MKKYEMTDTRSVNLRRIRALRDIPRYNVRAGDLGGWIESERNLSQEGDCWVGDNARASGNAIIFGNAWVADDAQVKGSARVSGNAWVKGNAQVKGSAQVSGNAWVDGCAWVGGNAVISGNARMSQNGFVNSTQDYLAIGPIGSRNDYTTFYRTASDIWVRCGCFNGAIDDFANEVRDTHGNNRYAQEYLETIDYVRSVFERRNRYAKTDNPHA